MLHLLNTLPARITGTVQDVKPMDCTTSVRIRISQKKDAGYYIWNGYENGGWSYGPLGTET